MEVHGGGYQPAPEMLTAAKQGLAGKIQGLERKITDLTKQKKDATGVLQKLANFLGGSQVARDLKTTQLKLARSNARLQELGGGSLKGTAKSTGGSEGKINGPDKKAIQVGIKNLSDEITAKQSILDAINTELDSALDIGTLDMKAFGELMPQSELLGAELFHLKALRSGLKEAIKPPADPVAASPPTAAKVPQKNIISRIATKLLSVVKSKVSSPTAPAKTASPSSQLPPHEAAIHSGGVPSYPPKIDFPSKKDIAQVETSLVQSGVEKKAAKEITNLVLQLKNAAPEAKKQLMVQLEQKFIEIGYAKSSSDTKVIAARSEAIEQLVRIAGFEVMKDFTIHVFESEVSTILKNDQGKGKFQSEFRDCDVLWINQCPSHIYEFNIAHI